MAVMLNTSVGDLVIDLFTDQCPLATKNFLKLCKIKYYNHCIFHLVQKDFIVQTGDPTGTGSGGDSIYKLLYGDQARFFDDEIHPQLKHDKVGIVAMASAGENANASQFYITTRAELDYLDGKHTVFGEVGEGLETLMRINGAFVDEKDRPYKNIRIKHTTVLDDPFDDPAGLADLIPDKSPELKPPAEGEEVRLEDDWVPMDDNMDAEELERSMRRKEAQSRAVVLEMIGDLPEAEMKPPENVLFVCKLNPVTEEGDLEIIFGRFGKVMSADIIRDYKTGDSLCYAFIEFETQESCELAYFKMDNVLIDDRRIHVDFSQSVSHLWNRYRKLGAKGGDGQISNYRPGQGNGRGCFKCGEVGHFAKECPNNDGADEKEVVPEKPKYSIKDTGGQRGNTKKRYDMVFDEDATEPRPVEKSEGRHGLDKDRAKNEEHKRKGDSRDRDSGRRFYSGRDDERPRQDRQQERDRERLHESGAHSHNERRPDDRGSDRHHRERDRNRPRDGGLYSHDSQHQGRRGRAHDNDDRKAVNDTRDNARPSGASVRDFDRSRVDSRHAMEANTQEEFRKRRDTAKPLHEVHGDQDLEDSRNQRVIESKRQDDSDDMKKGGRSTNAEHSGEDYRNQRGLKESKQRNEDCGLRKVGQRSYREPSPDGRSNRKVEKRREREHSRDGYDDEGYSSRRRRH